MVRQWSRWALVAAGVVLAVGSQGRADDKKAQDQAPALPKPGPEYDVLKQLVGTWDAKGKMGDQPFTGTVRRRLDLGGLWLIENYKADLGGMPFGGHGLNSFDAGKKKYVGVWVDSMGTLPMILEGTYDAEKKTMTQTSEYPGPDGKLQKYKMVMDFKDHNTHEWTMAVMDKDGKETPMMNVTYTRKAGGKDKEKTE